MYKECTGEYVMATASTQGATKASCGYQQRKSHHSLRCQNNYEAICAGAGVQDLPSSLTASTSGCNSTAMQHLTYHALCQHWRYQVSSLHADQESLSSAQLLRLKALPN